MRSAGEITSVRRIPNLSLTTTTSPCATSVPLTNTSSGSPAARSSSTTEPWLSCSRLRIGMRVRPTSIDSVTGTSRITSRLTSRAPASAPASCTSLNSAFAAGSLLMGKLLGRNFGTWRSGLAGQHHDIGSFQLAARDAFFDLHSLLAVRHAELAAEHGNVLGQHRGAAGEIARENIAGLEREQLLHGDLAAAEHRAQLHFGVFELLAQRLAPTLVVLGAIARHACVQQLFQRLEHRIRHRDVNVAATAIELDAEA